MRQDCAWWSFSFTFLLHTINYASIMSFNILLACNLLMFWLASFNSSVSDSLDFSAKDSLLASARHCQFKQDKEGRKEEI